ncbi:MAG: hypothetical protein KatS3mg015_1345 [Fimbriimonadales bacterium]|nr:MAG: hypothetical protein KatS3mg015_1345 [Fimbriimonadales bacterium]
MKVYSVKEIYYTLQGEGAQTGRPSVFLRFAGCNLWSGREEDRATAVCQFCDTDFVGTDGSNGGKYPSPAALAERVVAVWSEATGTSPSPTAPGWVVCTGGEPLLQLDPPLLEALHARGFLVAIETNGTLPVPEGVDWVCVSPKAGAALRRSEGERAEACVPAAGNGPVRIRRAGLRAFLPAADGRAEPTGEHAASHRILPRPPALEAQLADA